MPSKRARRHFSQLSEFERGLIIGMKTAGCSTRLVAGQVDRSECAVRNCWEQCTGEGTHARKTGYGATRKTTRREDRRIVRQALVDLTVTRLTIRVDVGVAIVPQTISRHLAEANLKSKRPFRALPLTPEHRQLRLQWCQARSMWNVTDWQKIVFSDESRFVWGQMIGVYGCGGTLHQRLKRDSPLNYMRIHGFIDFNVDTPSPFSCITPIDSFNHVEFREELLTSTPKHSSHPELLRQLALEVINGMPDQALIVYTDGSRSDTGRDGSGIFSNTPGKDVKISIRNPDHYSVFRSELIAISGALDHALNSYKDSSI
ncbi:transposable element Tc1 transposase [Trichonephila clavipes]|nr:transposable element Tc1 transposase [Trichonephila clavipes]